MWISNQSKPRRRRPRPPIQNTHRLISLSHEGRKTRHARKAFRLNSSCSLSVAAPALRVHHSGVHGTPVTSFLVREPVGNTLDACSGRAPEHKRVFAPRLPVTLARWWFPVPDKKPGSFLPGFLYNARLGWLHSLSLSIKPRQKKIPGGCPPGILLSDCCRPRTKPIRSCGERGSQRPQCSGP